MRYKTFCESVCLLPGYGHNLLYDFFFAEFGKFVQHFLFWISGFFTTSNFLDLKKKSQKKCKHLKSQKCCATYARSTLLRTIPGVSQNIQQHASLKVMIRCIVQYCIILKMLGSLQAHSLIFLLFSEFCKNHDRKTNQSTAGIRGTANAQTTSTGL